MLYISWVSKRKSPFYIFPGGSFIEQNLPFGLPSSSPTCLLSCLATRRETATCDMAGECDLRPATYCHWDMKMSAQLWGQGRQSAVLWGSLARSDTLLLWEKRDGPLLSTDACTPKNWGLEFPFSVRSGWKERRAWCKSILAWQEANLDILMMLQDRGRQQLA